ncbi:L-lactate MFS transporter [Clostridium sp. LBM24168]
MQNISKNNRWLIVIGSIIVQLVLGTIYTWSLFNQPIVNKFGWDLNRVALTFSITSFALSFSTLASGRLQERLGIRKLVSICGIALGIGLILTSRVSSLPMLYITAGVIVGAADGIAYMTTLSNCIKWFPEKKGLISGVSVGAYGCGSLLFKYINGDMIASEGEAGAFLFWGIITMILIFSGAQLLKDAVIAESTETYDNNFTVGEMLRTKEAYLLFIAVFTACMSGLYLIGVVKDIGVSLAGLDQATAANAVAMVAVFNTVGRIVLGTVSDRMKRTKLLSLSLLVTAAATFTLSFVDMNFMIFFTCVSTIAFCFGGNITIFPPVVGEFFGLKNQTRNYGVIYQGFGIGALSGSFIAGIAGNFRGTFIVIGVLCIISSLVLAFIKLPEIRTAESSESKFKRNVA